ncbi:MAG: hypothetical protein QOH06_2218 [Acidobacteriota bacterium]|jgi:hypothetical protein|nr:hypothetical protein [Acidobacteriota bacterium]
MRRRLLPLSLLLATMILDGAASFSAELATPSSELFPVAPAVNAQRGFAIALDGEWLAVGAPLEEEVQQDQEIEDAGAVYMFRLEKGLWIQKARLTSLEPRENGRFGHSVTLSGKTLAVGALGEEAVYVWTFHKYSIYLPSEDESQWLLRKRLPEAGRVPYFGGAVALDGETLAVGAVDPHGAHGPGTVYIYQGRIDNEFWDEVDPAFRGVADERFGYSLSLRAGTLAVGAPGAEQSRGAVYVFESTDTGWKGPARLTALDAAPGDQLGFAVAVEASGKDVVVGAPTADASGHSNSGALYAFHREGEWEGQQTERLTVASTNAGDQLGHVVAIDGDLLVAGAPFGSSDLSGALHVLGREGLSWRVVDTVKADNIESGDLYGFSAAVQGSRVVAGAVLVDQGGRAAGSAYTFQCDVESGCVREAEPVANDEGPLDYFGLAIDTDGETLVVGGLRAGFPNVAARGVVYVYRRAGTAWLQEARLESPFPGTPDGFGFSVALSENTLVVGAPFNAPRGAEIQSGSVYRFQKIDEAWVLQPRLTAPTARSNDGFGFSVAATDSTIVVGAFTNSMNAPQGAVYLFERDAAQGVTLVTPEIIPGKSSGVAVAASGGTIAVGIPSKSADLPGSVHLFLQSGASWVPNFSHQEPNQIGDGFQISFGTDVSVHNGTLFVSALYDVNDLYVFEHVNGKWIKQALSGGGTGYFGEALDLHENTAVIVSRDSVDNTDIVIAIAQLFVRTDKGWTQQEAKAFAWSDFNPNRPFAATIAKDFFAVTAPADELGDRVSIFKIQEVTE